MVLQPRAAQPWRMSEGFKGQTHLSHCSGQSTVLWEEEGKRQGITQKGSIMPRFMLSSRHATLLQSSL